MKRRVLFTTRTSHNGSMFLYAMPKQLLSIDFRFPALGLKFLKANIPGIEIMEYPFADRFLDELSQGVDVLGISLFTRDVPLVKSMVQIARQRYGVKEIWGGNYGVLTPGVPEIFDRVFTGYVEDQVHYALTGRHMDGPIKHPPIVGTVTVPLFPQLRAYFGVILTHRDCNLKCTFCQTPVFAPKMKSIDKKELEKLIDSYHKMGVNFLLFAEENFIPSLNRDLLDRINHYGMQWISQSRADSLHGRVGELVRDTGYAGSIIGIESLRTSNLKFLDKRTKVNTILETLEEARQEKIFMQGTYMFGYEDDTIETLEEDAEQLLKLPLLVNHYFVITPYPQTGIARYIEDNFGTPSDDWIFYDSRHLVWNHPNISRVEMHSFLDRIRSRAWKMTDDIKMGLRSLRLFNRHIRTN